MTTDGTENADAPAEPRGRRGEKTRRPLWQELLTVLVVTLVVAALVKALLFQSFYIPSESMEPGLVRDDRILVEKVSYELGGSPQRGDVVVFEDPGDWLPPEEAGPNRPACPGLMERLGLYPSGGHLVKRVIGVAGDTIHCCDDRGPDRGERRSARRAGVRARRRRGLLRPEADCEWNAGPVPRGSIFVMGDNRSHSADSSFHLCPAPPASSAPR